MSVINQMLKDLDARAGDAPSRRAALASVGQGAPLPAPSGRARRLRFALLAATIAAVAFAAWVGLRPGSPSQGAPLPQPSSPDRPAAAAAVEPPVEAPRREAADSVEPLGSVEAVARAERALAPAPKPEPASALVGAVETAPVASASPVRPSPRPPRSRIEVVDAPAPDPLAGVREALAAGDAAAALAALDANRPTVGDASAEAGALAGAALQQLSRHREAIEAYTRALRDEPDIGAWWVGLAISLEAEARRAEALAAYREARRRGPLAPALTDYVEGRIATLSADADVGPASR